MPLRQILKTYTKSELAIIAWRSGESAYNLDQMHKERADGISNNNLKPDDIPTEDWISEIEDKMGADVVEKLGGIDGEVDLRKLTGDEVLRYMKALGS